MKWRQHGYVFTNLRFDTLKQKKMYSNSDLIIGELRPFLRLQNLSFRVKIIVCVVDRVVEQFFTALFWRT